MVLLLNDKQKDIVHCLTTLGPIQRFTPFYKNKPLLMKASIVLNNGIPLCVISRAGRYCYTCKMQYFNIVITCVVEAIREHMAYAHNTEILKCV